MNELPEAPVSLNTNVKSAGGFEYQLTIRGTSYMELIKNITKLEEQFKTNGLTPMPKYSKGYPPRKEIELLKDSSGQEQICSICNVGKIKIIRKDGNVYHACTNNKFSPATRKYEGCSYFENISKPKIEFNKTNPYDGETIPIEEYEK
jgi:hypothetical protein